MVMKEYDVVIVGGGVTGTAILYTLSHFTNVGRVALVEKYGKIAAVQSSKNNNSQTLHFGDIETNYTVAKAEKVKAGAELVAAFVEQNKRNNLFQKFQKMVLAVGSNEVKRLEERYEDFKELFPRLRKVYREELKKLEPKIVEGRDENVELMALYTDEGYAVDYGMLSEIFVEKAKRDNYDVFLNSPVTKITPVDGKYIVTTNKTEFKAKVVMIAASASSLTFAHKLGYGKEFILLPVAGDFFCSKKKLNGKVYMMQKPKLPFAAIHGDPAVDNVNITRFGPIAKVLPILEKRNVRSFFDFVKLFRFKWSAIMSILNILKDPIYYRFVFWNVLYGIPYFGKFFFVKEVRKITPSMKPQELHYGRAIGGIRPQVVDTKTKKVALGEAKIMGDNIIFNITPSPGASTCLQNAVVDVKRIVGFLGKEFNEERMRKELQR